ncbi:immunoglobulin alpha-2 heavy chain-like [Anguilla rostrata]|uniref:Ig-like domain-containing protein n=1 Tax=Anguilla anguilla TaxID=7936 RepID=A0A9D3N0D9_ANGAN|nr:immunoglobulin alpha-2 heavy chain-like [Anguilla anguilla]KAG5856493.1 hypothetical protein ANANG_G00008530 [Anguilla anguilla]
MSRLSLLIWFIALIANAGAVVLQNPLSLRVAVGTSVKLHCDISGAMGRCAFVWWLLVQPRTGLTIYRNTNAKVITVTGNSETADKACILIIPSTKTSDTGTYYCAVSDSRTVHYGNGTTLVVTERVVKDITMEILVPGTQPLDPSAPVTVMCVVSGVDPSKARVHWQVEGKVEHAELPPANALASDSVRTWLSVPGPSWASGAPVTCVLETAKGLNLNRTVSRTGIWTLNPCMYLLAAMGGASFLVLVTSVLTVCVIWQKRSRLTKSHPRSKSGINWSRPPQQVLEQVQYTSLRFGGTRREAVSHF